MDHEMNKQPEIDPRQDRKPEMSEVNPQQRPDEAPVRKPEEVPDMSHPQMPDREEKESNGKKWSDISDPEIGEGVC
ncbi:MAG: hypothetical protein LUE93_06965 [Bacteroides sp.]|nr:hypothetical protein [Bacteroides sp.]